MFESNQKLSRSRTTFLKRENKVLQIGNLPKAINSQFQSKCLAINNVMKSLYVLTVYSRLFTIYMGKPFGSRFGQLVSKIPYCGSPFGTGVYHLHKSFPFTERVWNWYQR